MRILRQVGVIFLLLLFGQAINKLLLPVIPSRVIGMFLLLLVLMFKILPSDFFREVSEFFLSHLAFFFVPVGVGLAAYLNDLEKIWWQLLLVAVISTVFVMAVTGLVIQFFIGEKK